MVLNRFLLRISIARNHQPTLRDDTTANTH
jgi:hypothetical protein